MKGVHMEFLTSMEVAKRIGKTKRWVNDCCAKGLIKGAYKEGNRWRIPENAKWEVGSSTTVCARTIGIGIQDFEKIITSDLFYVDKTDFISEWWSNRDDVTLITRPRRFGKSLTLNMVERFFSNKYRNMGDVFAGLKIWNKQEYRELQGKFPVIGISFAGVKENSYDKTVDAICNIITECYKSHREVLDNEEMLSSDRDYFLRILDGCTPKQAPLALNILCRLLYELYGEKTIILLDEYDTPMQEAYINGFWDELVGFVRNVFNSTFKTNSYLYRGLMTGITRISKESIFSDLNNIRVITTSTSAYADKFGFTEEEVSRALKEYSLDSKEDIRKWYDGFQFGDLSDIYNPWSILSYLQEKKLDTYWANTSSNGLVSKLIREGDKEIKRDFEKLLSDKCVETKLDEEIAYNDLNGSSHHIWSLLMASGYVKPAEIKPDENGLSKGLYMIKLTNLEVKIMFRKMVSSWFESCESNYNEFIKALISGDLKAMNYYMNQVALSTFSYFDTGKTSSYLEPERFYHGFVLGLLVDMANEYCVKSNRESGFGRYDVIIEPYDKSKQAFVMEFKVRDPEEEKTLEETVESAKKQIDDKEYKTELINNGIIEDKIFSYGFAFEGKKVLIK